MRGFLGENFAATFAGECLMRLSPPHSIGKRSSNIVGFDLSPWCVSGSLSLKAHGEDGKTESPVTIVVKPNWLEVPPEVFAHDKFIRREIDWHTDREGRLCYVLSAEWKDRLANLMTSSNEDIAYVTDYAVTWLLAASDSLITRHLLGSRHGIQKWPATRKGFAHFDEGIQEYLREKN